MQLVGDRTLTSQAGSFTFAPGTRLSHAKLIRDTVTAGFLGSIPHVSRPTPNRVILWVRQNLQGPIATDKKLSFEWTPPEGRRVNHIVQLPSGKHVIS
jgi:hypothetical protein